MKINIDPLTGQRVDSNHRLVFDWRSMKFVSLGSGEKLLQNPLKPNEINIGRKLLFDPLELKYYTSKDKLVFDPLKLKYIGLKKGEKLSYDYKKCKFVKRVKTRKERKR